jgi:hypothetical protein
MGSTKVCTLLVVFLIELIVVALLSLIALGKANETTRDGALLTLSKIDDLTKWMATLEIAILGGLAYLVLGTDTPLLNRMTCKQQVFAMVVGMNLGISLLICGWLLTSLASVARRIYGVSDDGKPTPSLDIATWSIYGHKSNKGFIKLNYVIAFKHWFWGLGLASVALLVISLVNSPPSPPEKKMVPCVAATGNVCQTSGSSAVSGSRCQPSS